MPTLTTLQSSSTPNNGTAGGSGWKDSISEGDLWVSSRRHVNDGLADCAGFRFRVPLEPLGYSSALFSFDWNVTNQEFEANVTIAEVINPFAFAGGQKPTDYYTAAAAAHGSVPWADSGGPGDPVSPELATILTLAIDNATPQTDDGGVTWYYALAVIIKSNLGSPTNNQMLTELAASPPELALVVVAPPDITASIDTPLDIEADAGPVAPMTELLDLDARSASPATYAVALSHRTVDLYVPLGATPDAGWPLIVWIHGGSWQTGNKNQIPDDFIVKAVQAGYAVASVQYALTTVTALLGDAWWSHAQQIQDVTCQIKHLYTTFNLDETRLVIAGYSAGGHMGLFLGLGSDYNDVTQYEGLFSGNMTTETPPGRRESYPNAQTGAPYNFSLSEEGATKIPQRPLGIFAWGAPVDLWQCVVDDPATPELNNIARNAYMGQRVPASIGNVDPLRDEADLNHYLAGSESPIASGGAGPYDGPKSRAPAVPIGYVTGWNGTDYDDDGLVPASGGINALRSALAGLGYSTSAPPGIIDPQGLTEFQAELNHGPLMTGQGPDYAEFFAWLAAIDTGLPPQPDYFEIDAAGALQALELVGITNSAGDDWGVSTVEIVEPKPGE